MSDQKTSLIWMAMALVTLIAGFTSDDFASFSPIVLDFLTICCIYEASGRINVRLKRNEK